jgi:hypothetical protein
MEVFAAQGVAVPSMKHISAGLHGGRSWRDVLSSCAVADGLHQVPLCSSLPVSAGGGGTARSTLPLSSLSTGRRPRPW